MENPGSKRISPGETAEFKGAGFLNFNGANRIVRAINARVTGGDSGPSGSSISVRPIRARITSALRDGSKFRWFYSWEEIIQTMDGYDGYETLVGGRSGVASEPATRAHNDIEKINGTSGMTGIGVTIENIPDGFAIGPIPNGTPIDIWPRIRGDSVNYWFSAPNGIDGTCATSGDEDDDGGTP